MALSVENFVKEIESMSVLELNTLVKALEEKFGVSAAMMAAPAAAAAAVICFAFSWNEFLFALILTSKNAQPITVVIAGVEHTQGIQFWFVATRLLFAIIPPTLLALTAQRYIVRGLTLGAVKG